MRTSARFGTKNFGFFEIYGVSAWIREVEPVRTRGRSIFRDFVSLLWTASHGFTYSLVKQFISSCEKNYVCESDM